MNIRASFCCLFPPAATTKSATGRVSATSVDHRGRRHRSARTAGRQAGGVCETHPMTWFIVAALLLIALALVVVLLGMRWERQNPPSATEPGVSVERPPTLLPLLSMTVLVGGVGASAVLAYVWPLQRVENEIS